MGGGFVINGNSLPSLCMRASDSSPVVEGLTTVPSRFSPKETMDRLESEIQAKGLTIFARIDHSAGAMDVGLTLRPTELIIFGNAPGGTPLMQSTQTVGIDLPLKALVWEDAAGKTWISYNEPRWVAHRHGVANAHPVVNKLADLLRTISTTATGLQKGKE
jgi:uncharacterized protein (DUF302 family)